MTILKKAVEIEELILIKMENPSLDSCIFYQTEIQNGISDEIDMLMDILEHKLKNETGSESTGVDKPVYSEIINCWKHYKALKRRFEIYGMLEFCNNNKLFRNVLINPNLLLDYIPLSLLIQKPSNTLKLYDKSDSIIKEGAFKKSIHFLNKLKSSDWEISDCQLAKTLAYVLQCFKSKADFCGWVVLNAPVNEKIWKFLESVNLAPNNIIYNEQDKDPNTISLVFYESQHCDVGENDLPLKEVILAKLEQKIMKYTKTWNDFKKCLGKYITDINITEININGNTKNNFLKRIVGIISSLKNGQPHLYTMLDALVYDPISEQHPLLKYSNKSDLEKPVDSSHIDFIYGDTHPYCPVALLKYGVYTEGHNEFKVFYKNKIYLFYCTEFMEDFLLHPEPFILRQPISLIPPKICVVGAVGCQGSKLAKKIAAKVDLCYLNFDNQLKTKVMGRNTHPIGVLYESRCAEVYPILSDPLNALESDKHRMNVLRSYVNCKENCTFSPKIILHKFVKPIWDQHPYKTQGLCYYRFPKMSSDLKTMIEEYCFPDCIVYLQSNEDAVLSIVDRVRKNWQLHRAIIKKGLCENDQIEIKLYMKYVKELFRMYLDEYENAQTQFDQESKKPLFNSSSYIPPGISSLIKVFDLKLEQIYDASMIIKALEKTKNDIMEYKFQPHVDGIELTEELNPLEDLYQLYKNETNEINQMKMIADVNNILWIEQNVSDFNVNNIDEKIQLLMQTRSKIVNRVENITPDRAQNLLNNGLFYLSRFGYCCPVKKFELQVDIPIANTQLSDAFPVIYRHYIYFLSSQEAVNTFTRDPEKYLNQSPILLLEPLKCSIIGPPESGKTVLANRLATEFGLHVVDIKSAINYLLNELSFTKTAQRFHCHLQKEGLLTDEMIIFAIESELNSPRSLCRGWVLDGFPTTKEHFYKMHEKGLSPFKVFSLQTSLEKCTENLREKEDNYEWLDLDYFKKLYGNWEESREPDFDDAINNFWGNLYKLPVTREAYFTYQELKLHLFEALNEYLKYIHLVRKGLTAALSNVLVTQMEVADNFKNVFEMFCPGCLNYDNFKLYPKKQSFYFIRKNLIQHKHNIYWVCPTHFNKAIEDPIFCFKEDFDLSKDVCKRICLDVSLEQYNGTLEYEGNCIVCYCENSLGLKRGCKEFIVDYRDNFYCLCSYECLQKFTAKPSFYSKTIIEKWEYSPPQLSIKDLNIPLNDKLYLERNLMAAVNQSIISLAQDVPYIPGLSSQLSGCIILGYNLICSSIKNSLLKHNLLESYHHFINEQFKMKALINIVKAMPNPYHPNSVEIKHILNHLEEGKEEYLRGLLVLLNNKKKYFIKVINDIFIYSKVIVEFETNESFQTNWFILLNKIPKLFSEFVHIIDKVIHVLRERNNDEDVILEVRNEFLCSLFCNCLLSVSDENVELTNHLTHQLSLDEKALILDKLNPFLNFIKEIKQYSKSECIMKEFYYEKFCFTDHTLNENSKSSETDVKSHSKLLRDVHTKENYVDDLKISNIKYNYDPYMLQHSTDPRFPQLFSKYLTHVVFPEKNSTPIKTYSLQIN
uniref:Uncharacterized protein n=1 Tax=Clastoptera arizonana TaxID=38151 RepID=A0A1B6CJ76_9HEMI